MSELTLDGVTFTRIQHYDRTYWSYRPHPEATNDVWFDNTDETVRDARWLARALDALDAAEAKLAAIDALHHAAPIEDVMVNGKVVCAADFDEWPCPTHRILHPEEVSERNDERSEQDGAL